MTAATGSEQSRAAAAPGWANMAQASLGAVGAALSIYLLRVHALLKAGDQAVGGLCDLSSRVNCTAAAQSAFSEVQGVPIAALGLGFYVAVVGLATLWQLRPGTRGIPQVLLALHAAACAYSLFLAIISGVVLGALCWACSSLYAVNIAGLVLAKASARQGWRAALQGLYRELIPVTFSAAGLVFGVAFVAGALGGTLGAEAWQAQHGGDPAARAAEGRAFVEDTWGDAPRVPDALWAAMQEGASLGPAAAPVTVVAFSDFECPFCGRLAPELHQLVEEGGGRVRVVFRHYPLDQACNPHIKRPFHEAACAGAAAGVCAEAQGGFWPMHDHLFAHRTALGREDTAGYAEAQGLDRAAFVACLEAPATAERLQRDIALGREAGVKGTPSLFINGKALTGAKPRWVLQAIVEHEASP